MRLLKCPKCGEMFSETYKSCPFCQEDEELHSNKPIKRSGRRTGGGRAKPQVGGVAVAVCLVMVLGLIAYTMFGSQITALFAGEKEDPKPTPTKLVMSQTSVDMTVGNSIVLTAFGADKIVFSSSDESVATVAADGTLRAVGVGSAVVTATDGEQSATCQVTVEEPAQQPEPPDVPAKGLTLRSIFQDEGTSLDDFSITPGEEVQMVVDGTESVVTWKIGDTSVATISADGVVTGVSNDTSKVTTITATVDGQTLTCNVRGRVTN